MIVFVGGGRRVELAKKFFNLDTVSAIETEKNCPIFRADFPVFRINTNDLDCYKFGVCIPLQDEVASRFSQSLLKYNTVVVSPSATSCYDKKLFEAAAKVSNWGDFYPFPAPGEVIIKPRFGHGSEGVLKTTCISVEESDTHVIQKFCEGVEYTADCFFDNSGHYVFGVVRRRDRTAGGEVVISTIVDHPKILEICKLFDSRENQLWFRGAVNIQFIENDRPYIIEVNARFGGGYTLSIEAGMPAHQWTIDLAKGLDIYTAGVKIEKLRLIRSFRDHYFKMEDK